MGVAAYNRGSLSISTGISRDHDRPIEFEIMDRLNALPKYPDAGTPFTDVCFEYDENHKVWWILDAENMGDCFGYWYKTLNEAVKRWNVTIVECNNGIWKGVLNDYR